MRASRSRGWLLDIEGVLCDSMDTPHPLPGARGFLREAEERGSPVALLSNISRLSHRQVLRGLRAAGFRLRPRQVTTAGLAAASYLRARGHRRVYAISEGGLARDLEAAGLQVVRGPPADAVAVGAHRGLTGGHLTTALGLLHREAPLVLCGGSATFRGTYRGRTGVFPGEGSIAAALRHATGAPIDQVGKPDPRIYRMALQRVGLRPAWTVMVGDGAADILGAHRAHMAGAIYIGRRAPPGVHPDRVFPTTQALFRWYRASRL
ncbi:MAG: HAD family hydrolase [Euryarchaeota archaeon]|nr:HAD family hydrolase [Euryarchaeota archaeon]